MSDIFFYVFGVVGLVTVGVLAVGVFLDVPIVFKFLRSFFGLHEHNWRQILGSKKYSLVCKTCGAMK